MECWLSRENKVRKYHIIKALTYLIFSSSSDPRIDKSRTLLLRPRTLLSLWSRILSLITHETYLERYYIFRERNFSDISHIRARFRCTTSIFDNYFKRWSIRDLHDSPAVINWSEMFKKRVADWSRIRPRL